VVLSLGNRKKSAGAKSGELGGSFISLYLHKPGDGDLLLKPVGGFMFTVWFYCVHELVYVKDCSQIARNE
jgi:hypothetical protein